MNQPRPEFGFAPAVLDGKTILVADDHPLFRRGLSMVLMQLCSDVFVLEASDTVQTKRLIKYGPPIDLVLLDLAMPGMNGLGGLSDVRRLAPGLPVVMLSAHAEPEDVREAHRRGACGYLHKSITEENLKHALLLILSGEAFVSPTSPGRAPGKRQAGSKPPFSGGNLINTLTKRQKTVLAMVMDGKSNKEISAELSLREGTIKSHVKVILRKLGAENRTEASILAADLGLKNGYVAGGSQNGSSKLSEPE